MATLATQKRIVRPSGRAQVFALEMLVTDKGGLPDTGAFLMQVVSGDDPTLDTFVRVCTVADVVVYSMDRVAAVLNGDRFYRTAALLREQTDVRVAQRDAEVVSELVDNLVTSYATYALEYSTDLLPGDVETFSYPLADPGVKATLVAAYTTAVSNRDSAQADLAAKVVECSGIDDRISDLEATAAILDSAYTAATLAVAAVVTAIAAYEQLVADSDTFLVEVDGGLTAYAAEAQSGNSPGSYDYFADPDPLTDGEPGEGSAVVALVTYRTALLAARAALVELRTQRTSLQTQQAALQAQVTALGALLTTARAQKVTCAGEAITLQYALNAQNAAVASARADLESLCPDYDFGD